MSSFDWPSALVRLRSPAADQAADGLQATRTELAAPHPHPIPTDAQQPTINALMHLMHDRSEGPAATAASPVPHLALACVSRLFEQPTRYLTEARAQVMTKKMQQLWTHSAAIKALFGTHHRRHRVVISNVDAGR